MKLCHLTSKNFRSLEQLNVKFSETFTAISGKNDAGKSNLFDAIKILIGSNKYEFYAPVNIDFDSDFPKWVEATDTSRIEIEAVFTLESDDAAMRNFIQRQISLSSNEIDQFTLKISEGRESKSRTVSITALDKNVDGEPAVEVWRRLRSGSSLVFHNSTMDAMRLNWGAHGQFSDISQNVGKVMAEIRQQATKKMKKVMASSEAEIQALFGRLSEKWKVSLELPELESEVPFHLALGDSSVSVRLENWGSGTKNRAMIVLALLRAAQSRKSDDLSGKVVPVVVIEEPESFLHGSAQAEFGSLLIDLANELNVQVIVATHSAYLLNTSEPSANVLMERKFFRGRPRQSVLADVDETQWMRPFSEALGLSQQSLEPWREMLKARGKKVVLVEGPSDVAYLKMLQEGDHGDRGLPTEISIIPYGGFGTIINQAALKVMLELADRAVVTVDLDALDKVQKTFDSLSLVKGTNFLAVGENKTARRCIEGLLPDRIRSNVLHNNPGLFEGFLDRTEDERSIRFKIKSAYQAEFEKAAVPGDDFAGLYKLASQVRKALEE